METNERIAALEAETMILRRYVRALISMLPRTQGVNAVLADTVRMINLDARNLPKDQQEAWETANTAIGALSIPRNGLLGGSH